MLYCYIITEIDHLFLDLSQRKSNYLYIYYQFYRSIFYFSMLFSVGEDHKYKGGLMIVVFMLPIFFSALLSAAHFYRAGSLLLTAASLLVPLFLFIRNRWTPRIITLSLFLAAVEWLRTMLFFIEQYQQAGLPWIRLAIILTSVCLFTALSPLVFKMTGMKRRYLY